MERISWANMSRPIRSNPTVHIFLTIIIEQCDFEGSKPIFSNSFALTL